MLETIVPDDLLERLEWKQTGDWQYVCVLGESTVWPVKDNGKTEWLWQVGDDLLYREGGVDLPFEYGSEDGENENLDIASFLNDRAGWRLLTVPRWSCTVDLEEAGKGPDVVGFLTDRGEEIEFSSFREMARLLWQSIFDYLHGILRNINIAVPLEDWSLWLSDREWRRTQLDAAFRETVGLEHRREHPYTILLRFTIEKNVWQEFEDTLGDYQQIPYSEIVRVIEHLEPEGIDGVGETSIESVRNYFERQGYETATEDGVSVDELIRRLRPTNE